MTEMQTTKGRLAKIDEWLNLPATLAKVASLAPKHQRAERIIKLAWMQISGDPKLAACTLKSIAECVLTCAQLGLEPNSVSQHAHFLPFRDNKTDTVVCTLVPGYKGLIDLATRSGRIITFKAQVVRVGDVFEWQDEPPKLIHKRDEGEEDLASPIRYAYAVATHNDAQHYRQFEVLSKKAIDVIRSKCQAKNGKAWVGFYEAMGMKSAVIRLCKYMTSSVELASAVTLDDQADSGITQTLVRVEDSELLPGLPDLPNDSTQPAPGHAPPQGEHRQEQVGDAASGSSPVP